MSTKRLDLSAIFVSALYWYLTGDDKRASVNMTLLSVVQRQIGRAA